jgi:hypothetical protein
MTPIIQYYIQKLIQKLQCILNSMYYVREDIFKIGFHDHQIFNKWPIIETFQFFDYFSKILDQVMYFMACSTRLINFLKKKISILFLH